MKNTFTYLLLLLSTSAMCQNLVPNPSFEDTVSCPTMGGQVNKAKFWHSIAHTPDYYHSCNATPAFSVPNNTFGYQYPATGDAYMGLDVYDLGDTNYREILGAYLVSPLDSGTKYYVNFKVSFSAGFFQAVNIATNRVGILFSTVDYLSVPPPVNNFSQVFADTIISDSLNWTPVKDSFISDSAYSFISIGNFFKNYQTDTINLNPLNRTRGYYYVDDVCISEDSLYCELWTGLPRDIFTRHIKIYPNPASDKIAIENIPWGCTAIEMYDVTGRKVKGIKINNNFKTSVDLTGFSEGIYSFVFKTKKSIIAKKIIHSNN